MTDDRANIKLPQHAFNKLKADKPDSVTWEYYLLELRNME